LDHRNSAVKAESEARLRGNIAEALSEAAEIDVDGTGAAKERKPAACLNFFARRLFHQQAPREVVATQGGAPRYPDFLAGMREGADVDLGERPGGSIKPGTGGDDGPLKLVDKLRDGRNSLLDLLRKRTTQQTLKTFGDPRGNCRFAAQVRGHQLGGAARKGPAAMEELVEENSERVDVDAMIVVIAELLGGHVRWRTDRRPGAEVSSEGADAEVADLRNEGAFAVGEEDIFWFEIAMHHAAIMGPRYRLTDGAKDHKQLF
jgi:hypothetical protein